LLLVLAWILAGYIWAAASRAEIKTRFCRTAQMENHIMPCVRRIVSFLPSQPASQQHHQQLLLHLNCLKLVANALRVCGIRVNLYSGSAEMYIKMN
jgi:hypothetical protein